MKLINNSLSPLPFYTHLGDQNHRKEYAYGQVYSLICPIASILPFQAIIDTKNAKIHKVKLHDFNTGENTDITQSMINGGLETKHYKDFTVVKYPSLLRVQELKFEGRYYIVLQFENLDTLYSDVFTCVRILADRLRLEYSNPYNFTIKDGIIDFSDNFTFWCYINSQIGKPEYVFEEEASERMGYSFIESQVSKKVYRFTFIAPEYLCDALRVVRMCQTKRITVNGRIYDLTAFNMDVDWQEQGDLAAVSCEFETDTVLANIGGYTPEVGSFNDDFNNDFAI